MQAKLSNLSKVSRKEKEENDDIYIGAECKEAKSVKNKNAKKNQRDEGQWNQTLVRNYGPSINLRGSF